ncbi:MAG: nuclear transport factor 2 family protein [Planctomycetes bacterium]|nr:nuclear transport factor 2 family protein [Planctomycetota bacterium]
MTSHIHSIFQAFIRQDREALRSLHSHDWVGFLGPSTSIERGLEAYMAGAEKSLNAFKGVHYELLDTDIQVYGDIAIVYYVAKYDCQTEDGEVHVIPLRSVDIY